MLPRFPSPGSEARIPWFWSCSAAILEETERCRLVEVLRGRVREEFGIDCMVELVPPHTLPQTSSGKISRTKARADFLLRSENLFTLPLASRSGMAEFVQDPKDDTPSARFLTVALTGGTGFIGRAVIRRLLQERVRVRALVRPASISSCFEAQGLSWIQGELGSDESLRRLVDGASVVIHCAGSVRGACEADFVPANVSGVEKIVQAAGESADSPTFSSDFLPGGQGARTLSLCRQQTTG